jgi:hypothetical protein
MLPCLPFLMICGVIWSTKILFKTDGAETISFPWEWI